jgi:ubiquinone/menaquinone biosynthesis C-methylase UbiE
MDFDSRDHTTRRDDSDRAVADLLTQADVYASETGQLLDRIGLQQGASVIDVGCGPLGILPLLSARLSGNGRTVGLDIDRDALAIGKRNAERLQLDVETVHADAHDTGLTTGSFDLVHARALLLNVTDPEAVVSEMARIARLGGVVVLQEPDSSSWICDPPHPAWDIIRDEIRESYVRTGRDFDTGRRAARMLRDTGLSGVDMRVQTRITAAGDYYQTFLITVATRNRSQILAGGRFTPDRLDCYLDQLRAHLNQPDTLTSQPAIWQAWASKR